MEKKKEDRLEEIYYCFRYRCKICPKAKECEDKEKKKKEGEKND